MTIPKIFKPEDFIYNILDPLFESVKLSKLKDWQKKSLSDRCNGKIEAWLRENGKVVYGENEGVNLFNAIQSPFDTHQALLICVQKIEKNCEHKIMYIFQDGGFVENKCSLCGKKLKPKSWEVCE